MCAVAMIENLACGHCLLLPACVTREKSAGSSTGDRGETDSNTSSYRMNLLLTQLATQNMKPASSSGIHSYPTSDFSIGQAFLLRSGASSLLPGPAPILNNRSLPNYPAGEYSRRLRFRVFNAGSATAFNAALYGTQEEALLIDRGPSLPDGTSANIQPQASTRQACDYSSDKATKNLFMEHRWDPRGLYSRGEMNVSTDDANLVQRRKM
jgi:hypothetical protein